MSMLFSRFLFSYSLFFLLLIHQTTFYHMECLKTEKLIAEAFLPFKYLACFHIVLFIYFIFFMFCVFHNIHIPYHYRIPRTILLKAMGFPCPFIRSFLSVHGFVYPFPPRRAEKTDRLVKYDFTQKSRFSNMMALATV
ncbi:hypothetical protein F5Y08DRAFT_266025 [Xylaria arbuscula]|nr:hypothetical protein F5Y08DRAFT_266025 [Xylaria arbuscula]